MPYFEYRIKHLRAITTLPMTQRLTPEIFTSEAQAEMEDIKSALLSDPLIKRADPEKRIYLRTDFSSIGFGFVAL